MEVVHKDDVYVLNHCTKNLASYRNDAIHDFGQYDNGDKRGRICEAWRFPIVDSHYSPILGEESYNFNEVTFIYDGRGREDIQEISLTGTFGSFFERTPLKPVKFGGDDTGYWTATIVVNKGEAHYYKFIINGKAQLDPINPQTARLDTGKVWSQFFTHLCTTPLTLEPNEIIILDRLVDHILPFQTKEGKRFLDYFYNYLDDQTKRTQFMHAYRMDQSVGVVNFIDKLLAKEERHHLIDYRICLQLSEQLLRKRNPFVDIPAMSKESFIQLYNGLGTGNIEGWDYSQYANPGYFLQLLRRHVITGAFSHPKYGGNVGGVCWAYLGERFTSKADAATLFDWRQAMEKPLGVNEDYFG